MEDKLNDDGGVTELMLACQADDVEQVQTLLEFDKADLKVTDNSKKTALHYCAENDSVAIAEILLDAEPSIINHQDEDGYNALHLAIIASNEPLARVLVGRGANVNATDNEKHSTVHWATVCGQVDLIDLLISHNAVVSSPDAHQAYPIHYAAQMCGLEEDDSLEPGVGLKVLKKLLQKRVPVDCLDKDKRQPLLWAASAGSGEACEALLKSGAKIDAKDKDGLTALHCAASRGHHECVEVLIKCSANLNSLDKNNCTPLFYAITLGHVRCAKILLSCGADHSPQDKKGRSPGHCAAAKGKIDLIKVLEEQKANLWLKNLEGDCPVHEAAANDHTQIVKHLIEQSSYKKRQIANLGNDIGRTCLHVGALNNNLELVEYIVNSDGYINVVMRSAPNKFEYLTPLDCAILKGNSEIERFLRRSGAASGEKVTNRAANIIIRTIQSCVKIIKERKAASSRANSRMEVLDEGNSEKQDQESVKDEEIEKQDIDEIKPEKAEEYHIEGADKEDETDVENESMKTERTGSAKSGGVRPPSMASNTPSPRSASKVSLKSEGTKSPTSRPSTAASRKESPVQSRSSSRSRTKSRSPSKSRSPTPQSERRSPSPRPETPQKSESPRSSRSSSSASKHSDQEQTPNEPESDKDSKTPTPVDDKASSKSPERQPTGYSLKIDTSDKDKRLKNAKSKLAKEVQWSVNQYQDMRKAVQELHKTKRLQIYTGYTTDKVVLKNLMETYGKGATNAKTGTKVPPTVQNKVEVIHSVNDWEKYLTEEIRVLNYLQENRPFFKDAVPEPKDKQKRRGETDGSMNSVRSSTSSDRSNSEQTQKSGKDRQYEDFREKKLEWERKRQKESYERVSPAYTEQTYSISESNNRPSYDNRGRGRENALPRLGKTTNERRPQTTAAPKSQPNPSSRPQTTPHPPAKSQQTKPQNKDKSQTKPYRPPENVKSRYMEGARGSGYSPAQLRMKLCSSNPNITRQKFAKWTNYKLYDEHDQYIGDKTGARSPRESRHRQNPLVFNSPYGGKRQMDSKGNYYIDYSDQKQQPNKASKNSTPRKEPNETRSTGGKQPNDNNAEPEPIKIPCEQTNDNKSESQDSSQHDNNQNGYDRETHSSSGHSSRSDVKENGDCDNKSKSDKSEVTEDTPRKDNDKDSDNKSDTGSGSRKSNESPKHESSCHNGSTHSLRSNGSQQSKRSLSNGKHDGEMIPTS